jgi:hypothetical protein
MPEGNDMWAAIVGAIVGAVVTYLLTRAGETERRRWSGRERISEMLAVIFSDYTASTTHSDKDIEKLRKEWATEGELFDILHDKNIGRQLNQIVTEYLSLLQKKMQGLATSDEVYIARSNGRLKVKEHLEEYIRAT